MRETLAVCLCVSFLSGCSHWEKPGSTEAEFEATKAECNARGFARFPPANISVNSGMFATPAQTNCTTYGGGGMAQTDCTTTPGSSGVPITVDQNQEARNADFQACLYENGWSNVRNR
jgi:hypothetical protein